MWHGGRVSFTIPSVSRANACSTSYINPSCHVFYHGGLRCTTALRPTACKRILAAKGAVMAQEFFVIENCNFVYECPKRWEHLAVTDNVNERHCGACSKLVYRCESEVSLVRHIQAGHCVAAIDRAQNKMLLGELAAEYSATEVPPAKERWLLKVAPSASSDQRIDMSQFATRKLNWD